MISILTPVEMDQMRIVGRMSAELLNACVDQVHPGVTTGEIDAFARNFIAQQGDGTAQSACLGYGGFPGALCLSVNEELIHGIPGVRVLQRGDIVSLDVCESYHGFVGDNTRTVIVGGVESVSADIRRLLRVTRQSLEAAVLALRPGVHLSDISHLVEKTVAEGGCTVVREYTGHGVGHHLHEDPPVPNYGKAGKGPIVHEGMTLAIEPMVNLGQAAVRTLPDGWTVVSRDGLPTAHFEYTVAVLRDRAEILTPWFEQDRWSDAWMTKT
ncbi:MAG: type I methionyl aminopeptidase [Kiritimatiellia bacterium]